MTDRDMLAAAIEAARRGRASGGIPIGGALMVDDAVVATGHNQRVQLGSAIRHGEMDCLENAGRLPASTYARATLATTLSPCDMCTGAILLYGIPRVIIGENRTFYGGEDYLRARGVEVVVLDDPNAPDDAGLHRRRADSVERGHRRGVMPAGFSRFASAVRENDPFVRISRTADANLEKVDQPDRAPAQNGCQRLVAR